MNIRELLLTDEVLSRIVQHEEDLLDREHATEMFLDLAQSGSRQVPPDIAPLDKMIWINRLAFLSGFGKGLSIMQEVIKEALTPTADQSQG